MRKVASVTEYMTQVKTILLNQYVGAIAIGFIVGRGIEAFVAAFMAPINAVLTEILGGKLGEDSVVATRASLISNLVLAGLFFLVAFLLASWLYAKPHSSGTE
jgi:hypothetical protein